MPTNLHFHTILHLSHLLCHIIKGIQVYMRQLLIRFQEKLSIVSMSCKAVNKSVKKKLRLQTSVNAPFQTGFFTLASV